jgi:poly(A) polymerase
MPVITPAFPSMCATNNITWSTKNIIQREMERAKLLTNDIFAKKATWKQLFAKHTFFTEGYKYYLSIISGSRSKEAQQMWSGLVQSKVRRLVGEIENSDSGVALAHPYVKGFDRVHECSTEEEVDMILHGDLQFLVKEKTTEGVSSISQAAAGLKGSEAESVPVPVNTTTTEDGKIEIFTTTYYIGLELAEDQGKVLFPLSCMYAHSRSHQEARHFQPRCHIQTNVCSMATIQSRYQLSMHHPC